MKHLLPIAIALVALQACVSVPAIPAGTGERITIEYHPGPFCGSCDSLTIIAASDGRAIWKHGYWQGNYSDWTEEWHPLRLSGAQFDRLRAELEPYRPSGEKWLRVGGDRDGQSVCKEEYSDAPERRILWESQSGRDLLWADLGCDPSTNSKLFEMLQSIPSLMGFKPDFATDTWIATTRLK